MKPRFTLFRRGPRFYCQDTVNGRQISLRTTDEEEARTLVHARNEAHRQPTLNLHIARAATSRAGASPAAFRSWDRKSTAAIASWNIDGLEVADDERSCSASATASNATQIRLGPARLTHCMRWLGQAKRCVEIARGLRQSSRRLWHKTRRPRKRADQARPDGAADPDRQASRHARRLEARSGRPRA